jgi:two-component system KDP operon response regulator KdpE
VSGPRVLLVDDDPAILRAVRRSLEAHAYEVVALDTGAPVAGTVASFHPDVILLDLVLPDLDGIEVCRAIRGETAASIIVLSAIGDESKKVEALDEGANDYVTKPFGMEELLARIRVALRRLGTSPNEPVLEAGPIRLRLDTREVSVDGRHIHLTPTEFELLRLLLEQQGRVLTRRMILSRVWGVEYADDSHILRTFMHQLRQKIAAASAEAAYLIVTDPGVGYRLVTPES